MTAEIIYIFKYIALNTSCQHCLAVVCNHKQASTEHCFALPHYDLQHLNDK
jgi:hypothetical protein